MIVPIVNDLVEDGFSSNTHPVELFGEEAKDYSGFDYKIPNSYAIDMLTLLPVNVNCVYAYWEINNKVAAYQNFALKLFEIDEKEEKEIAGFYFKESVCSKYIFAYLPSKSIVATICGIDENANFVSILRSNVIKTPNDSLQYNDDERWMSKDLDWIELIKASTIHFSHAKSSFSFTREVELLKKYGEYSTSNFSNQELSGEGR